MYIYKNTGTNGFDKEIIFYHPIIILFIDIFRTLHTAFIVYIVTVMHECWTVSSALKRLLYKFQLTDEKKRRKVRVLRSHTYTHTHIHVVQGIHAIYINRSHHSSPFTVRVHSSYLYVACNRLFITYSER